MNVNIKNKFTETPNKPSQYIMLNTPSKKQNSSTKFDSSNSNPNINSSGFCSLPKPDFSPFTKKEQNIQFKQFSSYKKQKVFFPVSPMKMPNQKYFTPINKIICNNLFNTPCPIDANNKNNNNHSSAFRKLNFDKIGINDNNPNEQKETCNNNFCISFDNDCNNAKRNGMNEEKVIQFQDLQMIKRISNGKFGIIYKYKHIKTNEIYAMKKSISYSNKNEYMKMKQIQHALNKSKYITPIIECYLIQDEEDDIDGQNNMIDNDIYYLYTLMPYYPYGDLFDYLSLLEKQQFKFTPEFYWDIIFQMLCGVANIHSKDFLHLDIKPTNFLVDKDGSIWLSDFGLIQNKNLISNLPDITEGDVTYLSPELFYLNDMNEINEKSDVFSLGISILEILSRVDLPKNGELWQQMRKENFNIETELPKEFFMNWNISKEYMFEYIQLLKKMICSIKKRKTIIELFEDIELNQIHNRYKTYLKNNYKPLKINVNNKIQSYNDDSDSDDDYNLIVYSNENNNKTVNEILCSTPRKNSKIACYE